MNSANGEHGVYAQLRAAEGPKRASGTWRRSRKETVTHARENCPLFAPALRARAKSRLTAGGDSGDHGVTVPVNAAVDREIDFGTSWHSLIQVESLVQRRIVPKRKGAT